MMEAFCESQSLGKALNSQETKRATGVLSKLACIAVLIAYIKYKALFKMF